MVSMVHATQKRAPANAAIFGFTEFLSPNFRDAFLACATHTRAAAIIGKALEKKCANRIIGL